MNEKGILLLEGSGSLVPSGKIFYDLKGHATRENNEGVAISRVELLYPLMWAFYAVGFAVAFAATTGMPV